MAVLEIQGNGESSYVPQEAISSAIQLLEDPLQRVRIFWITPSLTDFETSLRFYSVLFTGNIFFSKNKRTESRKDRQKQ